MGPGQRVVSEGSTVAPLVAYTIEKDGFASMRGTMQFLGSSAVRGIAMAGFVAVLAGCTDFSTTPVSLGHVTVSVTDQNNAGVPNLVVDLLLQDRSTIWRSLRTSSDGSGEFGKPDGGVISQVYIVRLALSGQFQLAANETNDKPVQVVIGQVHPVTFKVVKGVVTGP